MTITPEILDALEPHVNAVPRVDHTLSTIFAVDDSGRPGVAYLTANGATGYSREIIAKHVEVVLNAAPDLLAAARRCAELEKALGEVVTRFDAGCALLPSGDFVIVVDGVTHSADRTGADDLLARLRSLLQSKEG